MRSAVFLFLLFCGQNLFGQPKPYWIQSAGGLLQDEGKDVASDAANNIYTTGYFTAHCTFGTLSASSFGARDIFLSKNDSAGNFLWVNDAGGPGDDEGLSIATDRFGNEYICGVFSGAASFSGTFVSSNGLLDMFVAKYNSNGVLQWVKTGGGLQNDYGNAVAVDADGNIAVTGQFIGSAQFGQFNLTSMNDPQSGNPSIDIFTVKYDSTGTILWAKKGSAEFTDRGLDLAFDPSGNLYVTGQFSDTITFDQLHFNGLYNAIFLVKYDANGNEQWFRRIGGGSLNISYGIAVNQQSEIYLTGDFKGNMIFFTTPLVTLSNVFPNRIFLVKYNSAGDLLWAKSQGSDGDISSRNISLDDSSKVFLVGNYSCKLSEYANVYGQGTFNTAGFQDVFASKFDSSGNWLWARNYGGQYDDFGNGITVTHDFHAVITGGFQNRLVVPYDHDYAIPNSMSFGVSNAHTTNCLDTSFYDRQFISAGGSDLFILNSFDLHVPPYYYYKNQNDVLCLRPEVKPEISSSDADQSPGQDTITYCGTGIITANTETSSIGANEPSRALSSPGPLFTYLWSTGQTTRKITVTTSGIYSVQVSSIDGCFVRYDSVYVDVHSLPDQPKITDSKGININTNQPINIHLCRPDSLFMFVNNPDNDSITWQLDSQISFGDTCTFNTNNFPFTSHHAVSVTVTKTDSNGCEFATRIAILVDTMLSNMIPNLQLQNGSDSVRICMGSYFTVDVYDSLSDAPGLNLCNEVFDYSTFSWSISPSCTNTPYCIGENFFPTDTGWQHITCTINSTSPCGGTNSFFLVRDVYVTLDSLPVVNAAITGNIHICPGDSTTLTASGGASYLWSGSPANCIHGNLSGTSVVADQTGSITLVATDSTIHHCHNSSTATVYVGLPDPPVILMTPASGLVCPGDSVRLSINMSGAYHWQGPFGPISSNSSFIYEHTPGFYYCIVDTATCQLASNTVELKQYSTPILVAFPGSVICPDSSVTIQVISSDTSLIQWNAPLTGNLSMQQVSAAGTYTCSVTSCNIVTTASSTILMSAVRASVTVSGPTNLCTGDSVSLTANPGMIMYQWSPGNSIDLSIVVYQSGSYIVTTTDGYGCTATSAAIPVLFGAPVNAPVVSSNSPVCSGDTLKLTSDNFPGITYSWSGPASFSSASTQAFIAPAFTNASGNYTMTAFASAGCNSIATVFVNVDTLPAAPITTNQPTCEGNEVVLSAGSEPAASYQWTSPNGATTNTAQLTINSFQQSDTGMYLVYVSKNSCAYRDSLKLALDDCELIIPNVFTPNGDGLNDFFEIKNANFEGIDCKLFNRWGRMVGSWNSLGGKWDGTDLQSGTKLSDGVYYYILHLKPKGKNAATYHGFVEMISNLK